MATRPAINKSQSRPAYSKAATPAQNDHGPAYGKPAPQAPQNAQAGALLTALTQAEATFNSSKPGKDREAAQAALVAAQQAVASAGIDPKNPPPGSMDVANIQGLVGPGAEGATALANQLYGPGTLGQVSTGFDAQGGRIFENQDILNHYQAIANQYFGQQPGRPGETTAFLNTLAKGQQDTPEMRAYLAQLQGQQGRTGDQRDVLGRMQGGLGGYTSAENQAMLEQAQGGIRDQYNSQLRDLNKMRGRGAAVGAQTQDLMRGRLQDEGNLRRDIFVANADEKQRRLGSYGSYLGGVEDQEAGRRGMYGSALSGAESARQGRQNMYGQYMQSAQRDEENNRQNHFGRMMDAQGAYADRLQSMRDDELGRQQFNLGQTEKETAGRYGTYFGGLQLGLANREFDETERINDSIYGLNKESRRPPAGGATPTNRNRASNQNRGGSPYARYLGGA